MIFWFTACDRDSFGIFSRESTSKVNAAWTCELVIYLTFLKSRFFELYVATCCKFNIIYLPFLLYMKLFCNFIKEGVEMLLSKRRRKIDDNDCAGGGGSKMII